MCNHYQLPTLKEIERYLKGDLHLPLIAPSFEKQKFDKPLEIYPKSAALVLLYQDDKLQIVPKKWGYPSPFKDNQVLFNARVERFYEAKKSMWDTSFARRRCIILASQFFEAGKQTYTTSQNKTYHQQFSFKEKDTPLTMIAGIYDQDDFAMVTTKPNKVMAPVHDRMPLVLNASELRQWLFQNFTSLLDRSSFDLSRIQLPERK
ncbi:SOS response-associated peptidase family protein [uncultured Lactobacillus sp.]|uniref:SOS response-associated peptidase family protein n=1 Tax=uncultured Lactobacillus sp. TaxID=153152 RepID=UPI00263086E0|nr:SOS response-associated peptidase family protein [uncultured Lactobacillus sp.]